MNLSFWQMCELMAEYILPFDVMAPNATVGVKNSDMGIRSKYVGPDETGEKAEKHIKMARFCKKKCKKV